MAKELKMAVPPPTDSTQPVDAELQRWRQTYSGSEYYYGQDAGQVARRTVRYHRPQMQMDGTALDAGCGEGQDLAFLAEQGYHATGFDFTPEGVAKSRRLLESRGLQAQVEQRDIAAEGIEGSYDLVLSVNAVQFMGDRAEAALSSLMNAVRPAGVIGLSLFACDDAPTRIQATIFFISLEELLRRFEGWQPLEAAKVWQWNVATGKAQEFVTLIARNSPPLGKGRPGEV